MTNVIKTDNRTVNGNRTINDDRTANRNVNLESKFLEKIVSEEPWKIALRLNLLDSDEGSRYTMNDNFNKHTSILKEKLGEEKFKELSGIMAYANSMLLDFESALPYALTENKKESLVQLQENALLYGRSSVVSELDEFGRNNNIPELIVDKTDMQHFLVYHALPQMRLCRSKNKQYTYELEPKILRDTLDKISVEKKQAIRTALNVLEEKDNQNTPRKLIFSKILGDKLLIDKYKNELKQKYYTPREGIDALLKERAIFLDQGQISRLQFGDENPIFPIASNIFLVNNKGNKKVWKEDLRLYTDFSRLDGYSNEKEILSSLEHDNIVKLLGTFSEKKMNFLELEYAPGKTLAAYNDLSEKETLGITIILCNVLDYLHSQNIVYMDMKKKNVMYNRPTPNLIKSPQYDLEAMAKNIKLLDFGMSQKTDHVAEKLDSSVTLTTLLSTPEYLSPELTGFRSSMATDTFQLGLLLHSLIYKNHAYLDKSIKLKEGDDYRESEVLMYGLAVKFGKYTSAKDTYGSLLAQMLDKDSAKRPGLGYVKNELMNIYNSKFNYEKESVVTINTSKSIELSKPIEPRKIDPLEVVA